MTLDHLDHLGHLGYLILVIGSWEVGRRHRIGFGIRIIGSLLWAAIGWGMGYSSIVLWSLVFAAVDTRNLILWSRTRLVSDDETQPSKRVGPEPVGGRIATGRETSIQKEQEEYEDGRGDPVGSNSVRHYHSGLCKNPCNIRGGL